LDAQSRINWAEETIPTKNLELKMHNAKCEKELARMNARLKIVLADLEVMTTILEMTDCEKATLLQNPNFNVMKCDDQCSKKSFIAFEDQRLQAKVTQSNTKISVVVSRLKCVPPNAFHISS
jgi:hypothetical protein